MGQEAEDRVVNGAAMDGGGAGPGDSRSSQSQEAQPGSAQPQGVQPQSAQPQGVQPGSAQPQGAQPGSAQPQGVQPGSAQQTPGKSVRISSPEQVDDYIRVTTPGMWLLVAAMLMLLCALILWGLTTKIELRTMDQNGQAMTEYVTPASFLTDASTGN